MKRNSRYLLSVVLFLAMASPAFAADTTDTDFLFPIVASANGNAGTRWATQVCFFNPWSDSVRINIGLFQDGDFLGGGFVDLTDSETACFTDIIAALNLPIGTVGFLYVFEELETYPFGASARIYNNASTGTFGQNVDPVSYSDGKAWMFSEDLAIIPGVANHGTPGTDGARTNLGLANPTSKMVSVAWTEGDQYGAYQVYETTVPPYTVKQMPMNRSNISSGTIGVGIGYDGALIAYTSTVDNRSGDAVYKTHQRLTEKNYKSHGNTSETFEALEEVLEFESTRQSDERRSPNLREALRTIPARRLIPDGE